MMDTPHWNACIEYFRHQFSSCQRCQGGHDTVEELTMHLTVSHYRQEALLAFGTGPKCQECATVLLFTRELNKQHSILSHMACHVSVFIPAPASQFLMVAFQASFEPSQVFGSPTVFSNKSEPLFKEECNQNVLDNSLSESEIKCEVKMTSPGLYWQECEDFLKRQFPRCRTCQVGFDDLRYLKCHAMLVHYGDAAIKQFGSGNVCEICKDFKLPPPKGSKTLKHLIKRHMVKHLEQCLPENGKTLFLKSLHVQENMPKSQIGSKLKLEKFMSENKNKNVKKIKNALWQDCADFVRKQHPMCKQCQIGFHIPSALQRHYGNSHCKEKALTIFGKSVTCSVCKNFTTSGQENQNTPESSTKHGEITMHMARKHFELIIPEEAKFHFLRAKEQPKTVIVSKLSAPAWQDCIQFLKEEYPACQSCQGCFENPATLLDHVICVHYKDEAYRQFGTGNVCAKCNDYTVQPKTGHKSTGSHYHIQRHMKKVHLESLLSGRAKQFFSHVLGFGKNVSHDNNKLLQERNVLNEENLVIKLDPFDYICEPIKVPPLNERDLESVANQSLLECQMHFRNIYPNCQTCQQSYASIANLKLHLTNAHYGRSAIELFNNGSDCPFCEETVLPQLSGSGKSLKEKKAIKEHMSMHLEEFVVGKAKDILQKASEVMLKCVSENSGKQDVQRDLKCQDNIERKSEGIQTNAAQESNASKRGQKSKMLSPLWQDCENFFKAKYLSCKKCKKGHKNPNLLRLHLARMHYDEVTIRQFGNGENCPICKNFSIPPNVKRWQRNHRIKSHMAIHLESYIPDDEAKTLLLKANSCGPWSTKKRKCVASGKSSEVSQKKRKLLEEPEEVLLSSSGSSHSENSSSYWSQDGKLQDGVNTLLDMKVDDNTSTASSKDALVDHSHNEMIAESASNNISSPEVQIFEIDKQA